jgi:hypothetical protein
MVNEQTLVWVIKYSTHIYFLKYVIEMNEKELIANIIFDYVSVNRYSKRQMAVEFCMGLPFLILSRLNMMTLLPLCSLPISKVIFVEEKCCISASISSNSSKL